MTQEEFRRMRFRAGIIAGYDNGQYPIVGVNFQECLFGLDLDDGAESDDLFWVRCESVSEIKFVD